MREPSPSVVEAVERAALRAAAERIADEHTDYPSRRALLDWADELTEGSK